MAIPPPTPGSAALVTGASSGIGAELARGLAERGHDLVLVARRLERLESLAAQLRERHGRRAEVIACDVSEHEPREELVERVRSLGLDVEVLVLCAGFGMGGPFIEHDPDRVRLMLRTNVEHVITLAHSYVPAMCERGRGAVLVVSSFAGNQPMPYFGAYAATKAAATSFAEMLHEEVREQGVTVTALCPGGVRTEFGQVAEMTTQEKAMPDAFLMQAADCARAGLEGLQRGRRKVVPTAAVRALQFFGRHAPRGLWFLANRRLMT